MSWGSELWVSLGALVLDCCISDLPRRPFLLDLTVLLGDENVRADKTQRLHVGFVCL